MTRHSANFEALVAEVKKRVREISPQEVAKKLAAGEVFHLVDVREDHEWAVAHAAGAIHIGKGIIERDIEKHIPDYDTAIVLYCGGGYRSALAADNIQKMGYNHVLSMAGGMRAWQAASLPLAQKDA